jgi:hypothetical protein
MGRAPNRVRTGKAGVDADSLRNSGVRRDLVRTCGAVCHGCRPGIAESAEN